MAAARTPLFRILRRALATARAAQAGPVPADELLEALAAQRRSQSRRHFLRQAGLAAGGLALAACAHRPLPPAPPAPVRGGREVAIVGAGIAGLTAAWRLRQAGVPVRVYEAGNRIGGRMYSLRDHFPDGQVVELGGELIDTGHVRVQALCAEFGLALDDLPADGADLAQEVWWFGGQRRSERELVEAMAPLARALARDQARLPDDTITWRDDHGLADLDRTPLSQWLDEAGLDGWLRNLVDVAYTTEMGAEPERQSALNLIDFMAIDGDHFSIFGESDERFHVRGGNDLVVHALAGRLADAIETGVALESLREGSDGGVLLGLRQDGQASREVAADLVILALPFTTLRRVRIDLPMAPVKRRAIAELGYGDNAKLMIGFDRRVWREHDSNGSTFTDLALQSTWETSRAQPGRHGILTNFTGGAHARSIGRGPAATLAQSVVADLDRIFPGAAEAHAGQKAVRFHWPSQPWVQASYACYGPGQWTSLRGAAGEPAGRLHFAGEHCALDNQGFMEGGCETGEWAAAQVLERLGVQARAA